MAKVKYRNPQTGKLESVSVKPKEINKTYSTKTKVILWIIILILVIPVFVTAIMYLIGQN